MLNKDLIAKHIIPLKPRPTGLKRSGRLRGKVACVLFDVYGTLFVSASGDIGLSKQSDLPQARIAQLLKQYDIKTPPATIREAFFDAIAAKHADLQQQGIAFPEVEIDLIWMDVLGIDDRQRARRFAVSYEWIVNPVYPMPHLKEMLSELKKKSLIIGIISNAQFYTPYLFEWLVGAQLSKLGFNSELVFFSYQHGQAKPSAYLFKLAAQKLQQMHIRPEGALYVGNDMRNDIYPAHEVGFQSALFAGDDRSLRLRKDDPRCRDLTADLVVTDLMQILKKL